MTTKEILDYHYDVEVKNHFIGFDITSGMTYEEYNKINPLKTLEEVLIEFATFHVEAALKAAIKNIEIICSKDYNRKGTYACKSCEGGGCEEPMVDPEFILKSYNLNNIK